MTTATMLAIVVVITLSLAFQGRCMPHYQQPKWDLDTANWEDSFNYKGASKCKEHYLMKGLWRSACNHLYCLDEAHCAKNYNIYATGPVLKANWWDCLNKGHGGWCTCTDGSYLTGFYRTSGQRLHNLEEGYCRRVPHSTKWGTCYDQNVRLAFDKKGLSKCEKDGYFMVGLWKTRNCDGLYCIETFKCCQPAAVSTRKHHGYFISCDACQSKDLCKYTGFIMPFVFHEEAVQVYICICGPGFYLGADKRTCFDSGATDTSSSQSSSRYDLESSVVINCDLCNGKRCDQVGRANHKLFKCRE